MSMHSVNGVSALRDLRRAAISEDPLKVGRPNILWVGWECAAEYRVPNL